MEGTEENITTVFTTPGLPLPREMANRNKRKGFLKEMVWMRGTRTVFGAGQEELGRQDMSMEVDLSPRPDKNAANGMNGWNGVETIKDVSAARSTPARKAHVIPPSEMRRLPSNVFVTSQEFERARMPEVANGPEADVQGGQVGGFALGREGLEVEDAGGGDQLWMRAEEGYDTFHDLTTEKLAALVEGAIVAWKVCLSSWL
jgi:hypothetical protein